MLVLFLKPAVSRQEIVQSVYLYISQVTFAAVLLRLRQCNSLGQNTDIVSADTTAMQFYEFLNLCLVEVPNVTHSGHS